MTKKAPRANLRNKITENSNKRIRKNADLLGQLSILVFLSRLGEESRVKAFEEKSATIKEKHLTAVGKKMLKSTRG